MKDKTKILLAEDEPSLGQIIKESLESRNFEVIHCIDGESALKIYENEKPDLLVLDVMMPKKDGFTLSKEIRLFDKVTPIIFLTSKSLTQDVVTGFHAGGNDYLKKPFSIEELIVRINNLLNRVNIREKVEAIKIGLFLFDFPKQTLQFMNEEKKMLSHREAHLLFHLVKNKNALLERSEILNKLWGTDDFFTSRSMDVFVTKLRKKLSRDSEINIVNVRGYGYKLIC